MTSGVAEFEHSRVVDGVDVGAAPFLPLVASVMNPSIFPPLTSSFALRSPCGPPPLTSAVSW